MNLNVLGYSTFGHDGRGCKRGVLIIENIMAVLKERSFIEAIWVRMRRAISQLGLYCWRPNSQHELEEQCCRKVQKQYGYSDGGF